MSQLCRAKNLVRSSFRPPSPERAEPGSAVNRVTVASAASVAAGEMKAFDVEGLEIAVANIDGDYYAFNDICTHRRCALSDGELDATTLTCICHGSRFDVSTGDVVRGPAERPLQVYPVTVVGDELQLDVPSGG